MELSRDYGGMRPERHALPCRSRWWSPSRGASIPPVKPILYGLSPRLHELTAPPEHVASRIRPLDSVTHLVRQRCLSDLARLAGLPTPIPETATEPVHRRGNSFIPQHLGERVVAQHSSGWRREDQPTIRILTSPLQHGKGCGAQRDAMLVLRLRPTGRNRPDPRVQVDLTPLRGASLTRAAGRQHDELEAVHGRLGRVRLSDSTDRAGNVSPGQRTEVSSLRSAPRKSCADGVDRVIVAVSLGNSPREDCVEIRLQLRSRLPLGRPQGAHYAEYVSRGDDVHAKQAERRVGVLVEARGPDARRS